VKGSVARNADRAVWSLLLCTALGVLVLARLLTPALSGVGTHEQLGLPPCGILALTGWPCPACGLTTAFAHLAHFQPVAAVTANPMGLPLFLGTFLFVPAALRALWRGQTLVAFIDAVEADKWALRFVIAALLVWGARLLAWAS
jgi:hypothetical protein